MMSRRAGPTAPGRGGEASRRGGAGEGQDATGGWTKGYPAPVSRLIHELSGLPGIGPRSAERLALYLLKQPESVALGLSRALAEMQRSVRNCRVCANLTDAELCAICRDERRDRSVVMVVEQPRDVLALESAGAYRGLYHVLLGRIAPLEGIGPEDLTVAALLERIGDERRNTGGVRVREVVLGLNPTVEGDGTALYLAERLRGAKVRVTRLARGLPIGSSLEMANKAVLADAIEGRRGME
jgi:recombination protein RecR